MSKRSKVVFLDEQLRREYESLPDEDPLKKGIKRAIEVISEDCQAGENAKKDSKILRYYKVRYGVNNIRIYDLPEYFRLIYTLVPNTDKIEIISLILAWMDHKYYDKLNK